MFARLDVWKAAVLPPLRICATAYDSFKPRIFGDFDGHREVLAKSLEDVGTVEMSCVGGVRNP